MYISNKSFLKKVLNSIYRKFLHALKLIKIIRKHKYKITNIVKQRYFNIRCFIYLNIYKLFKKNVDAISSKKDSLIYFTPNWYHDFSELGVKTFQFSDRSYKLHQEIKQRVIFKFINKAISLIRVNNRSFIEGVELFCGDGYYSNYAISRGIDKMVGIDLEEESGEGSVRHSILSQARLITNLLGNKTKINFYHMDVFDINHDFDICICAGGLYHISNPIKLLEILNRRIRSYLIIQTVVSLENESRHYFERPAPGWTWGCRFSHNKLLDMVKTSGWSIIDVDQNILLSNTILSDRGSSYIFCKNEKYNK